MIPIGPEAVMGAFLIFCRVGALLMLMPGFSSSNVPAKIRLFLAIAISLALTPLLLAPLLRTVAGATPPGMIWLIGGELLVGGLIGLLARIFVLALQALAAVIASSIGYSGIPGAPIEGTEPVQPLVSLITVTAVVLMFQTGLHWEIIRGLVASYAVLPPGGLVDSRFSLAQITDQLTLTFLVTLRVSSPFLVYAIVIHLAVGIINKLLPHVPVYFVSIPVVLVGGLLMIYLNIEELLRLFTMEFRHWAVTG